MTPLRAHRGPPATIYGFGGCSTEDNQALLETITVEPLGLENSIARSRALTAIVATGRS